MRWLIVLAATTLACRGAERNPAGASPVFEVSADRAQLGFDAPFSIVARLPDAPRPPLVVRWQQVEGPPLREVTVEEGGLRFSARTPRLADCREGTLPWGIVPFSPRTRGEIVLQAEWRTASEEAPERERIAIAAAPRSRGLPNVPVDLRIYLGGSGWRVQQAPPHAHAGIEERDGIATLRPDWGGVWQLVDGEGRALRLQAGRYTDTPLDCGRAGCHGEIARVAQLSVMTRALSRRIEARAHRADAEPAPSRSTDDVACAAACHATGEPWTHDGGFFEVAADLGRPTSLAHVRDWTELPRALRRLGGVGCLACHGPSALPEAGARWSVLRSDVCAHCHDAPPRYGHVMAWQATSMARSDRDARARSDGGCTPCHTTWGFLRDLEGKTVTNEPRYGAPPPAAGHVGVSCSACHAVHDASTAQPRRSLLRTPPLPAMFDEVPEPARDRCATCLACHAPRRATPLGQASAAALWVGRGGVNTETGVPLAGPAPHLSIEGGCVGCHREGPAGVERGTSHGFRADRRACASCHRDAASAALWADQRAQIEKDARALWNDLLTLGVIERVKDPPEGPAPPPHAATTVSRGADSTLARAAFDLSLLLEDRGFFAHNLPYARVLFENARKAVERALRAPPRPVVPSAAASARLRWEPVR